MIFSSFWWDFYVHVKFERKGRMVNICSEKSAETTSEKVCLCLLLLYLEISSGHTHTQKKSWTLSFADFETSGYVCYVVQTVPSFEGHRQNYKRKIEKKSGFPNQCFFINSPTFPGLFPFSWCRWPADSPLSSHDWKLLVDHNHKVKME